MIGKEMNRIFVILLSLLALGSFAAPEASKPAYTSDIITLREYVDVRFDAQQKAVDAALASADRAVAKAEISSDKRFEAVNEFRKTLSDETATFMTRSEYDAQHKALDEKVTDLSMRIQAVENRSIGSATTWAYLVGALGISAAAISVFMQLRRNQPAGNR